MFTTSKNKKKAALMCNLCMGVNIVISVFAVILTLAAIAGVYFAHTAVEEGLIFGTTNGSLSIAALVLSLFLTKKALDNCTCSIAAPSKK